MREIVYTEGARQLQAKLSRLLLPERHKAPMLGVSPSQLSHYLTGRSRPTLEKAILLEDKFGIPARAWLRRVNRKSIGRSIDTAIVQA